MNGNADTDIIQSDMNRDFVNFQEFKEEHATMVETLKPVENPKHVEQAADVKTRVDDVVVPQEAAPQYVTAGKMYRMVIITSLLLSVLSVFTYDRFFAVKMASFDLLKHNQLLRKDLAEKVTKGQLTLEQAEMLVMKDSGMVKAFLDSTPNNLLVISSDVVLTNPKRLVVFGDLYTPMGDDNASTSPVQK